MSAKDQQLRKECVWKILDHADYSTSTDEVVRRARTLENFIKDGTIPLVITIDGASKHGIVYADAKDTVTVKDVTDEDEKSEGNSETTLADYIGRSVTDQLAEEERVRLLFDFLELEVGLELPLGRRQWLEALVRGDNLNRAFYGRRR